MPIDQLTQPVRNLVFLGMLLPSLSVSIAAFLAHRDHDRLQKSFDWIMQASQVNILVQQLVAHLVEFETGQRGYLLTGRRSYLDPYEEARSCVASDLATLREQTAKNPAQQERLEIIEPLVIEKLDLAAQTVTLEQTGQHAAAVRLVRTDREKKSMDSIRLLACEMSQEQEKLISAKQEDLASQTQYRARVLYALFGLNILSIGSILVLLRSLTQLRSIARVCAWSRTVEYEGEWLSFEEYLERRFNLDITHGISPAEAQKVLASVPSAPAPAGSATPADSLTRTS